MRVDPRDLRRDVRAHAHHLSRQLVDELERAQVEVVPGAGQQRVEVLEQRRDHQLEAPRREQVEQRAPQRLDFRRLGRKDIFDVLGQQPAHRFSYQRSRTSSSTPASIDVSPKKRICPSVMRMMRRNVSRQRLGARNGSNPSMISIKANARRKVVPIRVHFAGFAAGFPVASFR
jgi:hypothetical protein